MGRLQEIETRLAAITRELEAPGANLDALEQEVTTLMNERAGIMAAAERRRTLLGSIAGGQIGTVVTNFEERGAPVGDAERVQDTAEYRSAYLKALQGKPLTATEQRAIAASNVPGVIPTQTAQQMITKIKTFAPLLNEITLLHIAGNVSYVVEGDSDDAELHTENDEVTPDTDTTVNVTLGGYEIIKAIRISAKVATMGIDAFESWLTDILAEKCGIKIVKLLILGTGSSQPQGVEKANTWGTGNSISVALAGSLTAANVMDLIGLLPGGYDKNAKFLMSKKTLWGDFMKLRDDNKYPLVQMDPTTKQWLVMGYPVMIDDTVALHEAYLGDFKKIVGNLSEDITVASSLHSGFLSNSVDYRGTAIFDSKVALGEAFVKLVKAAS